MVVNNCFLKCCKKKFNGNLTGVKSTDSETVYSITQTKHFLFFKISNRLDVIKYVGLILNRIYLMVIFISDKRDDEQVCVWGEK